MLYRLILSDWASQKYPNKIKAIEGEFTDEQIKLYNIAGYNIYFFPNYPSLYDNTRKVSGPAIDTFRFVFIDIDLKDGKYNSKEEALDAIFQFDKALPTFVVDSGRGIHAYWEVSDLNALSYLKLQRRLCRQFKSDEAVSKICQLMRVPGTDNTKNGESEYIPCQLLDSTGIVYTCEQLDKALPQITIADEQYCNSHFNKTYNQEESLKFSEELPPKFGDLLQANNEVRELWIGNTDDRSKADYRLGHIMFGNGFTKDEATSVLVNSAKALTRAPIHRGNYATNIIEKIWTFENTDKKEFKMLSKSVKDILEKAGDSIKGTRFPCWTYLDDTAHGFRLGQVVGLIAGSGVGKTAIALNMFLGFVQNNPDYDHFFIPLEQPENEIADRWKSICGSNKQLYDKVHIISNYNEDGSFRHLSFDEIREYLIKFQQVSGRKVGCVVIDHIAALKKKNKLGENQDLMDICHGMKAFAIQTNTLLVMQSQAPRQKAGIGDLELDKDAAYGTVYFESYCDYLITLWQPLKRCYTEGAPTVTAFKFCKIRHKKQSADVIQEDTCYKMLFDSNSQRLRELTATEEKSFEYFLSQATNKRKRDRKEDLVPYVSVKQGATNGISDSNTHITRTTKAI